MRNKGFTLIELMIVVAIIAIIASIAIPNLLAARLSANESAAIATLRNVVSAQAQVQSQGAIDVDLDGMGEYGWFGEVTGRQPLRDAGGLSAVFLNPPVLSGSLSNVQNSRVNKAGYFFQMYLPDINANGIPEAAGGGSAGGEDANLAETAYICYGWPAQFSTTGNRAFVVNASGDVLMTNNLGQGATASYTGETNPPNPEAAVENGAGTAITGQLSIADFPNPANDTNVWLVVN